ncbi:MAG: Asp23/Gls24 family envelope stress response protein [Clostridia bacterium]|nr:Asp23/Gls24 family envelope stress response protein [Clostridia bacterium]MBR2070640.1 Asp23/Gls24 family envelope stress response protein [Clostridia bacterium]MBR2160059.1 Asp23/Gls24 family envelope stress response protein [Clostridia bacterium]MBR2397954.1 Asp23/Gls24 family envelope stress response protein [Clostridia bacterium]MBR2874273.1 Asp23/Gls24 family envelope stress response protein [Clostridia bacterium]
MSVNTRNAYGKISITDEAIGTVAGLAARSCYGIVDMVSRKFTDSIASLLKKQSVSQGVKISTLNDRIFIDLYIVVKYGISINAVAESVKESVKYEVEKFTGMFVETINVHIVGVKL